MTNNLEKLKELKSLLDSGAITEEEFTSMKRELLTGKKESKIEKSSVQSQQNAENTQKGCIGCLSIVAILFVVFTGISFFSSPKPEEQLAEWYEEVSPYSCEQNLKEKLRDPDSYQRDGDFVTSNDDGNKKVIIWSFRSKNGFGGYVNSAVTCNVSKENGGTISTTFVEN